MCAAKQVFQSIGKNFQTIGKELGKELGTEYLRDLNAATIKHVEHGENKPVNLLMPKFSRSTSLKETDLRHLKEIANSTVKAKGGKRRRKRKRTTKKKRKY